MYKANTKLLGFHFYFQSQSFLSITKATKQTWTRGQIQGQGLMKRRSQQALTQVWSKRADVNSGNRKFMQRTLESLVEGQGDEMYRSLGDIVKVGV